MNNIDTGKLLFMISHYTELIISTLEQYNYTENKFYKKLYELQYNVLEFSDYSYITYDLIHKFKENNKVYRDIVKLILSIYKR
jgi:hypothetical protein